ncbi:MAG: hypothetical protein JWN43_213 [Gammaproteobacteria bacterium]|nr:hypothetical protein [Gammaproteobacteria bacterium]
MRQEDRKGPRTILDETATSINELAKDLEGRELKGAVVTTREIRSIAGRLQLHVKDLLAASKALREENEVAKTPPSNDE